MAGIAFGASISSGNMIGEENHLNEVLNKLKAGSFNPADPVDPFWDEVARAFNPDESFINLENGYFSPQPTSTLFDLASHQRSINAKTSVFMRTERNEAMDAVYTDVAAFCDVSEEELVITRNTTESLDTVIHGIGWQKGDEVIICDQDYYSMVAAFKQEERRNGIITKEIDLPLNPSDDEEIVEQYRRAISPKTRMILLTHMINLNGHVLPAKKIIEMAHQRGVEVMLDAAHSFAHIPFKIKDLNPDYFGTSLHKWLCCPLGLGLLYIRKDKISKVWPLFGDDEFDAEDIRKLRHHGTRPDAAILSIRSAIQFHNTIGGDNKFNRLRYLHRYWRERVNDMPDIYFNSPSDINRIGAIANVGIKGKTAAEFQKELFNEHNIFTVAIETKSIKGIRVTPHLYTLKEHLDKFVDAIGQIKKRNK